MFSLVSGLYQAYLAPSQLNILMVGASGVGKTSILERCKVTQFSTKGKPLHRASKGFESAPNVPIHWLKPSTEDSGKDIQGPSAYGNPINASDASSQLANQKSAGEISGSSATKSHKSGWLCPAPKRYAQAAIDEEEVEENTVVQEMGYLPSPDVRVSRKVSSPRNGTAKSAVTKVSDKVSDNITRSSVSEPANTSNVEGVALEATDDGILSSIPLTGDEMSVVDVLEENKASVTKVKVAPSDPGQQEYDLKAKAKMLAFSKIRRTIGMNVGKITIQGVICNFWDLGGRMFELWERYYNDADAVIFVWKTPYPTDSSNNDQEDENDDDDENALGQFDYARQLSLLEAVRSSIPDDVPFLVLGHVFLETSSTKQSKQGEQKAMSSTSREKIGSQIELSVPQTDIQYSTARLLPHYHNPYQALFFANAANGQGVKAAIDWLIPIAKRQLQVRETRQPVVEKGGVNK